ncbi:DUF3859 domain-containing protein [Mariniphaga sp.]|uniref:DUF3859 domain-containing protein n=1 Tax=Mariniphaga sp. TaxID=1954475 RepID=UPI003565BE9D
MMAKRKPVFKMISYGEYSKWNRESAKIPHILNFTTRIEAEIGTEFGYVLQINGGKGETLSFKIEHPPFKDENGKIVPPFEGDQFIRTNDFQFYLGDCAWQPLEDKLGYWELTTYYSGKVVAHKDFELVKK